MLENVYEVEDLKSLARIKNKEREFKSIPKSSLDDFLKEGWQIERENKLGYRMVRDKPKDFLLEDRVWSLLYKMGFSHLSGKGGAYLILDPKKPQSAKNQIDIVGLDSEVSLGIECKSSVQPRKNPQFQEQIAKHAIIRQRFANAINNQFKLPHKRIPILAIFTWDVILTDNDIERARHEKIGLFNEHDLNYYEQLVGHLGPAAKYQFFADMLPDRRIHGLEIKVPALRTKMAKNTCYIFSISPQYLLKIAYVSHRVKGKATDIDTYQRMVKKSRLVRIRDYITDKGIFPTNIIISVEKGKKHIRFDPHPQKGVSREAEYGTLHLTPCYKCAWIIDGQHRLFAYSGHERAAKSHLSVLAFEGLPPSQQAQLFIDINHEQKSVKRSLLYELYAELHWDAEDETKRIGAIISKCIQALNEEKDSPFCDRILFADATRSALRCISLESLFKALNQPGLFIVKKKIEYGPLWAGDNLRTLKRSISVIKEWFNIVNEAGAFNWWDLGSDEGGGLAMNDGVTILVGVLRSVFEHLASKGYNLIQLTNDELVDVIRSFGEALGEYLGKLSSEERKVCRAAWRGGQGQTAGRRTFEKALHSRFPDFEPKGLKEFLELEAAQTNKQAYGIIQRLEKNLKSIVLDSLKNEYGDGDPWWYNSVPPQIRKKVNERIDEEQGAGGREDYFDLIDFRAIALKNWQIFKDSLAYGAKGDKNKKTDWIVKINDMRKIIMHPAKGRVITWQQLSLLKQYKEWLEQP